MDRDKVIELANKAGFNTWVSNSPHSFGKLMAAQFSQTCQDELVVFAALVEKETLERAAKVCDEATVGALSSAQESSFVYCAESIRNLKDNHGQD